MSDTIKTKRSKWETALFLFITATLLVGLGLCLTSLLAPNWVYVQYIEGIVIVNVGVGLLQKHICDYQGCRTVWFYDEEMDNHPLATFGSERTTLLLLNCGISSGFISLGLMVGVWRSKKMDWARRTTIQSFSVVSSLMSSILIISAPLVTSANVKSEQMGYASLMCGGSSACMLLAALLVGSQCHCHPLLRTSSAQEAKKNAHGQILGGSSSSSSNKKLTPLDKAFFINFDYNSYYCVEPQEKSGPLP